MLKRETKINLIALLLIAVFAFSACDKNDDGTTTPGSSDIVGSWLLTKIKFIDIPDIGSPEFDPALLGVTWTATFGADGEFSSSIVIEDSTENVSGTYATSGNQLTITVDDEPENLIYSISGNTAVLSGLEQDFPGDTSDVMYETQLTFTRQ
ncbi:MAG: lipocalin family protein [Melioribacteraceae bacterium]|nr:lipocalin family protein [Melioribacteraceae bacterium]MCF8354914.1 lipocalin family protein [Melioribacteraceae bacterium]MCF8395239.1 lipocalin family protein [Melioribacteraceae bacterium]MCF8420715.1 lipocalin family protein [Melioribacteraceae bacterium]